MEVIQIADDLRHKFQLEINTAGKNIRELHKKIAQHEGLIAGLGKAQELAEEYIKEILSKAEEAKKSQSETGADANATDKDKSLSS